MYHIEFTPELIAHLEAMEDDTIDCTAGSLEILDMSRNSHRLIKGLIDNITKLEHENAVLTRALCNVVVDAYGYPEELDATDSDTYRELLDDASAEPEKEAADAK